jgi:hypothetical protein
VRSAVTVFSAAVIPADATFQNGCTVNLDGFSFSSLLDDQYYEMIDGSDDWYGSGWSGDYEDDDGWDLMDRRSG